MGICMIGHFAFNSSINDGQTVKTNEIYNELIRQNYEVDVLDTFNYKKNIISFFFKVLCKFIKNDIVILVLAGGGAKTLIPLLSKLNFLRKKRICYCCIGSWLDNTIEHSKRLSKAIFKIDKIFVETEDLERKLKFKGLLNVEKMYNFKQINEIKLSLPCFKNKFCTYSRVMPMKGIDDAIWVFNELNNKGYTSTLDIYGPIEKTYQQDFYDKLNNSKNVKYMGSKNPNDSAFFVSQYDALIFPTHYINEGLPGTLIDAYCSGVPVIASDWNSAKEFINDNIGYVYDFANKEDLLRTLERIINNPESLIIKGSACLDYSKKFLPKVAIQPLIRFIKGDEK